jgi:hypothetical protein
MDLLFTVDDQADFVGGFVAAEGCFTAARSIGKTQFAFRIALGSVDAEILGNINEYFGVGTLTHYPRRKAHFDDESNYAVSSLADLIDVIVPFMDSHLPASYKREQFLVWRDELLDYWETRAKRVRPCSVAGCALPRRAHGLCRRHLYAKRRV